MDLNLVVRLVEQWAASMADTWAERKAMKLVDSRVSNLAGLTAALRAVLKVLRTAVSSVFLSAGSMGTLMVDLMVEQTAEIKAALKENQMAD